MAALLAWPSETDAQPLWLQQPTLTVAVPTRIDAPMNRLLDHFVRDFISNWYELYDVSKTREFQSSVRGLMRHVMIEFGLRAKRANATSIALPLFQVVIVHMVSIAIPVMTSVYSASET